MAQHLEQGAFGERYASTFLKQQGCEVLVCNWRFKNLEIDIIAKEGNTLLFVEVKTRKSTDFGDPFEFVDIAKQNKIIRAADEYLEATGFEGEIRFDILSVIHQDTVAIEWIKDAFWAD